jgi:hypothetical protein
VALSFHGPYTVSPGQTCSIAVDYMSEAMHKADKLAAKYGPNEATWNKLSHEAGWNVIKTKADLGQFKTGDKVGSWLGEDGKLLDIIFSNKHNTRWQLKNTELNYLTGFQDDYQFEQFFVKGKYSKNGNTRWGVGPQQKPPSVLPGSTSTGAVTDEDMASLFVQTKDVIAKELDLPIKGANPLLDKQVYAKIAEETGYSALEVKAKVDAYKASGKKLSVLKKKVLKDSGPKLQPIAKVPEKAAKAVVKEVKLAPEPIIYEDKAIAEQYIIAKDHVVASSNGKWTLYSKSDALDKAILDAVNGVLPGINQVQLQAGLKNYIASGKKLSGLKKELIKNGKLKPEADTLKGGLKIKDPADPPTKMPLEPNKIVNPPKVPEPAEIPKPLPPQPSAGLPDLTDLELQKIFDLVKGKGVFATSHPSAVYNALVDSMKVGKNLKAPAFKGFRENDILSLVRAFDKAGAKKFGVENTNLYEKKLTNWIQHEDGKQYILSKKQELLKAEKAKEEMARFMANMPDLPPDSDLFKVMLKEDARGSAMDGSKLSGAELQGIKTYTGSSYSEMNGLLRSGRARGEADRAVGRNIDNAQRAMKVFDRDVLLHRGTSTRNFGVNTAEELYGLVGKTVEDKGFTSSSIGGRSAFSGNVEMVIQAPKGVARGSFVDDISRHKGENEMLLAHGTKFKVLRVERISDFQTRVFCRIVGVG